MNQPLNEELSNQSDTGNGTKPIKKIKIMLNDVIYRWHEKYADENGVAELSFSEIADELLVTEDELWAALDEMYPELHYHWVDGCPERTIRVFFP